MTHSWQKREPPAPADWHARAEPALPARRPNWWMRLSGALLGAALLLGAGALGGYLILGLPETRADIAEKPHVERPGVSPVESPTVGLPPGAPSANEAAAASVTEAIGDWVLICGTQAMRPRCALQQRLTGPDGDAALVWSIYRDDQGNLRTVWQMPTKVETSPGIAIDLGDGSPRTVPFEGCDAAQCSVRATLAPEYVELLTAAANVSAVVMMATDRQLVRYRLSASGLAEALPRLDSEERP